MGVAAIKANGNFGLIAWRMYEQYTLVVGRATLHALSHGVFGEFGAPEQRGQYFGGGTLLFRPQVGAFVEMKPRQVFEICGGVKPVPGAYNRADG